MKTELRKSIGGLVELENRMVFSEVEVELFATGDIEQDRDTFFAMIAKKERSGLLASVYVEEGNYYLMEKETRESDYSFEKFLIGVAHEGYIDLEELYGKRFIDNIIEVANGADWEDVDWE